ncbi:MAG: response regulator [Armatimonadetes bacterium]|nr:response regulator [Armatimonadota bacterium]
MVSKGNVLVVDDEINLCRIIGAKLAKSGYSVTAVHDGEQAIERVRESDYDVVLLDLILPKVDGLSALAEIRSIKSSVPVIVMTACENTEAVERAKAYGISGYVSKPFDLDSLVSLVCSTCQAKTAPNNRKMSESTVLFSKDQPITIEMQNGCTGSIYPSKICSKDDRTLTVLAPKNSCGDIQIPTRAPVKVGLAAKDAYYSFSAHVVASGRDPEPVLVLDKPNVIYRSQRRQHPRLALRIPISYALGDQVADSNNLSFKPGETRDLSLGGACIFVGEEVEVGSTLRIELRPAVEIERIGAVARVLRSTQSDQPGEDGWLLGCQFIIADSSLHDLLED